MEVFVKEGRSVNFTAKEILVLIEIVNKYKHIVESKKTDGATWREKDDCWSKITDELNSRCGETYRKKKSVKTKYEDIKKNLKKKLSRNKAETFKTGGGAPKIEELTSAEEMLLSLLPSTIQGLPSVFDSDAKCDEQIDYDYENIEMDNSIADNINESQIIDTDEWCYEVLDSANNESKSAFFSKHVENASAKKKRIYLESITNMLDTYPKKARILDVNEDIIEKETLALKDDENGAPSIRKKQIPSPSILSEKYSRQTKNVVKTKVSKELKVEKLSKSFEKNDIVKLAIAKEELAQLQKTALELDVRIKKEHNNTQKEIVQTELEITKEKLKLIKLNVQLKEVELEIKRQQLIKLL